jgi:hypothetical protein
MNKLLILLGLLLIILGVIWPVIQKLHLGNLPGDIAVKKGEFNFYFPITTCIAISIVGSIILWFFKK